MEDPKQPPLLPSPFALPTFKTGPSEFCHSLKDRNVFYLCHVSLVEGGRGPNYNSTQTVSDPSQESGVPWVGPGPFQRLRLPERGRGSRFSKRESDLSPPLRRFSPLITDDIY